MYISLTSTLISRRKMSMRSHRMNPAGLTVAVPCRDDTHTVCFNAKGQLGLLNHISEREKAWEELGGEICTCRKLLRTWKKTHRNRRWSNRLPPALRLFWE